MGDQQFLLDKILKKPGAQGPIIVFLIKRQDVSIKNAIFYKNITCRISERRALPAVFQPPEAKGLAS